MCTKRIICKRVLYLLFSRVKVATFSPPPSLNTSLSFFLSSPPLLFRRCCLFCPCLPPSVRACLLACVVWNGMGAHIEAGAEARVVVVVVVAVVAAPSSKAATVRKKGSAAPVVFFFLLPSSLPAFFPAIRTEWRQSLLRFLFSNPSGARLSRSETSSSSSSSSSSSCYSLSLSPSSSPVGPGASTGSGNQAKELGGWEARIGREKREGKVRCSKKRLLHGPASQSAWNGW